ncbi:MAG: PAS domain S-box protein, partial [Candidatus Thorarchaeota archaeon]
NITYVNPAFSKDAEELIGTPVINGVELEYREEFRKKLTTAINGGAPQEIEISETLQGRPTTWHILRIGPIHDADSIVGAVIAGYEITDRVRAMKALQENEEKFRGVFEHAKDAIILSDETGRIIDINPVLENLFGIIRENVIGMPVWELQASVVSKEKRTPEYELQLQKSLTAFFETGTAPWLEKNAQGEFINPIDGSRKTFEQTSFRIPTSKGFMLCSFMWDTTERNVAQLALDEVRERYELALKGADLGVWDWNAEADEMVFSERWADILGYEVSEIEPNYAGWEKLIHPEDIEAMESRWNSHVSGLTPFYSSEHRMRTKAGGWKWVLERGKVVEWNEEGGTKRALGTLLDITERKVFEKALQQSEEKYRSLLDNIPQRVFYKDLNSVYVAVNPAFAQSLGVSPAEVIGKTDYDFFPEELAERYRSNDKKVLETLETIEYDEPFIENEQPRIAHTVKSPFRDDEGNIVGILGIYWDITESQKAAEAWREQESRYRTIVEQSLMGIAIVPRGFQSIAFVNPKMCDILGYTQEELLSLSPEGVSTLVHPDDVAIIDDYLNNRLKDKEPGEPIQVRMIHKSGSEIWADFSAGAIEYGQVPAVQVSVIDITKRINAETEVLRERQVFKTIAEGAIQAKDTSELSQGLLKGIISSLGFDFGTIRLYDEKKNVLRYTALVGIEISDTVSEIPLTPEFGDEYIIIQTALNKNPEFISDVSKELTSKKYLQRLKNIGALSSVAYPILDDNNDLLGVLSLASNSPRIYSEGDKETFSAIVNMIGSVLERKKAEKALQISERRYRELLTNISEGMAIADLDENILFVNKAFEDMLGYSREELIGTSILNIIVEEDRQIILLQTEKRRKGESTAYTHRFVTKDGGQRIVRVSPVPSRDDDGQVDGTIAVVNDITERIQKDLEIQRLNEELAQRVEERTAELAAANKELEAFSYSVSHDLRAPLRTIDGFSQALLEDYSDVLDTTGKDFLSRVRSAASHMGSLIEDLLILSRVTRAEMDRVDVNLSDMAKELIDELQEIEREREVDVKISEDLYARCDQRLIKLVLQNLLENAWKFTSKVSNSQIEFGCVEKAGESRFFIKDNGAGFNMDYKDKLFAPFQRLHQVDDFPGSGIGLATVQRIINRHGGKVWAESVIGEGSTFYFTIPDSRSVE